MSPLPAWPPRDWRAMLALIFSVAGAVSLTALVAWLIWIVWRGGWPIGTEMRRLDILGRALLIALGGVLVVLFGLGWAINRRSIKGSIGGASFDMSGGDDAPPPAAVATTTTVTEITT